MAVKELKSDLKRKARAVRSLKSVLLKRMSKKARLNLSPFVGLSGGLWRRLVSGGVKQGGQKGDL